MYKGGHYYSLKINRSTANGQYLVDEEGAEVLLPRRYVSPESQEGDTLRVFVYYDSEDRPVATTETPLAAADEAAFLEVTDKTVHGVFLNWGLPKDLFLPARNQSYRMDCGKKYVVYLYTDNVTGRTVATARLNGFIRNEELTVAPGDETDILVAQENRLGYRVIVNNRHWGMLYHNQIFAPVAVGDRYKAYVQRITEDNRIDLTLQQPGYDGVRESAEKLLALLRSGNGTLEAGDDSTPERVHELTGMSKKTFKRSVGFLLKKGLIEAAGERIALKSASPDTDKTSSDA